MQGHHSAKPHTSCQVPRCHVRACCCRCCEPVDARTLSMHRSRALVRRRYQILSNFFPQEWGSAYTHNGLYVSIYGNYRRLLDKESVM